MQAHLERVELWNQLTRVKKHYFQSFQPICSQYALSQNELRILLFLYNTPELNRAADIVEKKGISKSNVSTAVQHMVERGLMQRSPDSESRRNILLFLTDEGRGIAAEAQRVQAAFLRNAMTGIDFDLVQQISCQIYQNICGGK